MKFFWPSLLWLLLALPLLVALYLWLLARRRKTTVRLASLTVAKLALGKGPGWRRHVPPALLFAAVGAPGGGRAPPCRWRPTAANSNAGGR